MGYQCVRLCSSWVKVAVLYQGPEVAWQRALSRGWSRSSTEKPSAQRLFASALANPHRSCVTAPLRFQVKELPSALHSGQISAHSSASGFAMQFSVELNDSMLRAGSSSAIPVVPHKTTTARPKWVPLAGRPGSPLRLSFPAS